MARTDTRFQPTWRAEHQLDRSVFSYTDIRWMIAPAFVGVGLIFASVVAGLVGLTTIGQVAAATGALLVFLLVVTSLLRPAVRIEISSAHLTVHGLGLRGPIQAPLDQVSAEVFSQGPHPFEPQKIPACMTLHVGLRTIEIPATALIEDLEAFAATLLEHQQRSQERLGDADDVPEALSRARQPGQDRARQPDRRPE